MKENNKLRHVTPIRLLPSQFTGSISSLDLKKIPISTQNNSVKTTQFESRKKSNDQVSGEDSQ